MTNHVSGFKGVTQTDENGEFVFNNLPLANYSLIVAAYGFAAENLSAEEVRRAANVVTGADTEDGFATAIEKFILNG